MHIYTRLLAEMHITKGKRSTDTTRLHLQDVLVELRDAAAREICLDEETTQKLAESRATRMCDREPK